MRGLYYEGWHPAGKPLKERKLEESLAHVAATVPDEAVSDPEAVFRVIARNVDTGEVEKVKSLFPAELRSL